MPKGKKKLILLTLTVYCFAFLSQRFSSLLEARAKEVNTPHVNIVTVLVDDKVYSSIQGDLQRYTTQYIQKEIPDSKALVIALDTSAIDAHQIYKMLENIYFDGLENVNSTFIGLIIIGDIPLPVINQEGYIFPSIYPYVDFVDQKYLRSPVDEYFVPDKNPNGQAELRHGLINYGSDIQAYQKFFGKIKKYIEDPSEFIGEDIWYEDFIANKEGFLEDALPHYRNLMIFGEDVSYKRYHRLMLDLFKGNQEEKVIDLVKGLNEDLAAFGGGGLTTDFGEGVNVNEEEGVSTQTVEKTIKEGFLANFPDLFATENGVTMRDNIFAGARRVETYREGWTETGQAQLEAKADSSIDIINLKDTINLGTDEVQGLLVSINDLFEQEVDKKIWKEVYDMDITIPVQYYREETERKMECPSARARRATAWLAALGCRAVCFTRPTEYGIYYFGQDANYINSAKELSIYRGTFRNLGDLSEASISAFNASPNPMKSEEEPTDLIYKNISASYDAFSTQVEANRGYNVLNAEVDVDEYERYKTYEDYDPTSPNGWKPHKSKCNPGNFTREYEITMPDGSKRIQTVILKESETIKKEPREDWYTDDDKNCEGLEEFTKRRWGGAALIRLDTKLLEEQRKYKLYAFTRRESWTEIFDIRGSKAIDVAEPSANSFKAYTERWEGRDAIARREYRIGQSEKKIKDLKDKKEKNREAKVAQEEATLTSSQASLSALVDTVDRTKGYASPTARKLTVYKGDYVHRSFLDKRDYQRGGFDRKTLEPIGKARLSTRALEDTPQEGTVRPTNHTPFEGLDYFQLNPPILTKRKRTQLEGTTFTINGDLNAKGKLIPILVDPVNQVQKNQDSLLPPKDEEVLPPLPPFCGDTKATYTYKTLSSIVKNTSPTEEELKGYTTTRYAADSPLTRYHNNVIGSLESTNDQITATEVQEAALYTGFENVTTSMDTIINNANGSGSDFDAINQELANILTELQNLQQLFQDLYYNLDRVSAMSTNNVLDNIEFLEQTFLNGGSDRWAYISWLTCPYRVNNAIQKLINEIVENFQQKIAMYKGIFDAFDEIKNKRAEVQAKLSQEGNRENIDSGTVSEIRAIINNFFTTEYTDEEGKSHTLELERDIFDAKIEDEFTEGYAEDDGEGGIRNIPGLQTRIDQIFEVDDEDIEIEIPWINFLTLDRPVDSPKYTTFQGIGGNEIKFIYPDIFKVESYTIDPETGKCKLKTVPEIKEALIKYLNDKVVEYNTYLIAEKAVVKEMDLRYTKLFDMNPKATPTLDPAIRPYELFTYTDLEKAVDKKEPYVLAPHAMRREGKPEDKEEPRDVMEIIAELLYYQNITNPVYACNDAMLEDVEAIQETFDINNKTEYVLKEYLTEKNEYLKSPLIISDYKKKGYEAAYINSDGDDYIKLDQVPTGIMEVQNSQALIDGRVPDLRSPTPTNEERDFEEKCWIPEDGTVLLFDVQEMNSPRLDAFKCRLKNIKHSVKLTFSFSESLGPIMDFDRFGKDGLAAYMKEYFAESLERRGDDMQDYEEQRQVLINNNKKDTNISLSETEYFYDTETKEAIAKSKRLADYYNHIKTNVSATSLNEKQTTSTLKISSAVDLGTVSFIISLTGDNCIQVETTNLCNGERSKSFNPKTQPQELILSAATPKAGIGMLTVAICNGADCVRKNHRIIVREGSPSAFIITTKSDTSIAGILTPITVEAFDSANNAIDWTISEYTITVDHGAFLHEGGYKPTFKVNRFKNLNFYYRAPQDYVGPVNIQLLSSTGVVLATKIQTVVDAHPVVSLNGEVIITDVSQQGYRDITLKNVDESHYVDGNNIRQLNLAYMQKVEIQLRDPQNRPINVIDAKVFVKSPKKLANIGLTGEKVLINKDNAIQRVRLERGIFEFENGKVTFYFYPTTTAGKDVISIEIPGLNPIIINIEIFPAPAYKLNMKSEPQSIQVWDTVLSEIIVRDIRDNMVPYPTSVLVESYRLSPKLIPIGIEGGRKTIELQGEESGLGYVTARIIGGDGTKPALNQIHIEGTLFPTSWLNIMYLNYFWNDRWNQRGYFSNNQHYIEDLMKKSNKIIATTTQLIQPSKIKEMSRGIAPNLTIKNYGKLTTSIAINKANIQLQAGEVSTITANIGSLTRITATDDQVIETYLRNRASSNVAFFTPTDPDYAIINGEVYKKGEKIDDTVYASLTSYHLGGKYQIRDVRNSSTSYGNMILFVPNYNITETNFTKPVGNYSIMNTFSNGTTNKVGTIGIFHNENKLILENGYLSIQDSATLQNNVGFRGDFKNITLFAQGERVGEATRKFWSEIAINLGDPLLKKYTKNPEVYDTDYDGGFWQEIFSDPGRSIFKALPLDFNNDGFKDMLVVYNDGTFKLAKNYGGEPSFINLHDLFVVAVGINDVYIGDVDGNGYEDITLRTKNNQLRTYLNHGGIFDVDGNLICLNTNVNAGEVTTTPGDMSGIFQFFIEDMDLDGNMDVVINDYKGYVKIFYGGSTNNYANYISKENYACDDERYDRQKDNTLTVTQLWFNLDERVRVVDNSMVTRYGLKIPSFYADPEDLAELGIDIPPETLEALKDDDYFKQFKSNPDGVFQEIGKENFDAGQMAQAAAEIGAKYREIQTSYPIGGVKTNIFVPISYLKTNGTKPREQDPVQIYKTYKNLSGNNNLESGNVIEVTVTIQAVKGFRGAFGDTIQGPWELQLDRDKLPFTLTGLKSNIIVHPQDADFTYLIDNIQLSAGQSMSYKYQLIYKDFQTHIISVEDIEGTDYKLNFSRDGYPDIGVQSENSCMRNMVGFINSAGNKHRSYMQRDIPIQDLIDEYADEVKTVQDETEQAVDDSLSAAYTGRNVSSIPGFEENKDPWKQVLKSSNIDIKIFDQQVDEIQQKLDKVQDGLCNGFSFWGSNNCQGLPVPFNQAILPPGAYHLFWCYELEPLTEFLGKGLPILSAPAALLAYPAIPAVQFLGIGPWGKNEATDQFLWTAAGAYPSIVRIYVAPTLTMQIGVAVCLALDKIFKQIPSPLADMGGNCVIFTIKPQCKQEKSQEQLDNPEETFLPRTKDLTESCVQDRKWEVASRPGYASTPFNTIFGKTEIEAPIYPTIQPEPTTERRKRFHDMMRTHEIPGDKRGQIATILLDTRIENKALALAGLLGGSTNSSDYSRTTGAPENVYANTLPDTNILGLFSLEGATQSSLSIGNVRIAPGDLNKNKVKAWMQQGLRKVIIDDRLDRQIRYIAAHFTKMHITIKLPDLNDLLKEAESLGNITRAMAVGDGEKVEGVAGMAVNSRDGLKKIKNINMRSLTNSIKRYDQLAQELSSMNNQIANPFEQLSLLFNESKLINVNTKNLTIKIPMIFQEDINSYEIYLRQRADTNSKIAQERLNIVTAVGDLCIQDFSKYETTQEALSRGVTKEGCPIDIDNIWKFSRQFELLLDQINQNILILSEYRDFPFQLYEWIHAIDRYVAEISAVINNFLGYISYRMISNANRYSAYVDAIILIMNIIKTYQALIDLSINRGNKCNTCTTDTYDQYSCKLSLLCPDGLIPVLQIPNFKIPDITLDLSNLNVEMNILIPSFNFQPAKIDLPSIPNLPSPPIGNIRIRFPNLPTIPELPSPPQLPELPSFIPNIKLELPMIPPAPKLPEIPTTFEKALNIAEKIWKIYCIIKKGLGLVSEGSVKAKIEQMTQRTYEVPRIDNLLDLTNVQAKRPRPQGFDYEIIVTTNIQFNFSDIYNLLDALTASINNLSTSVTQNASQRVQEEIDKADEEIGDRINNLIGYTSDEINYVEYPQAKQRLENVLAYFNMQTNETSQATTNTIQDIQSAINIQSNIQANQAGLNHIKQQIDNLLTKEQDKILTLSSSLQETPYSENSQIAREFYDRLVGSLPTDTTLTKQTPEQQLAFSMNFFNADKNTEKILNNLENPYKVLLDNKAEVINGFLNDLEYHPNAQYLDEQTYQTTKQTLTTLQTQIAGFYQRLTPRYQTTLQTQDNLTTKRTLTAATSSSAQSSIQQLNIDPASYIQGIFVRSNSTPTLTNVVYSTLNAEEFGKREYRTDINKDGFEDIILWNDYSIYIKYGKQNEKFWGGGGHGGFYARTIKNLADEEMRLEFDGSTRLKIHDQHEEVKNFQIKGQSFDSIAISRRKSREPTVDGYLLKLTERIDHSPEKQEITNKSIYKRFVVILPRGTEYTGLKLELTDITDNIEKLLDKELIQVRFFDPNEEYPNVILEKVERKRQYARIVTLTNNNDTLNITSPWSNQVVAGRQVLADDLPPEGVAKLYRPSTNEIVSTGDILEGFVGTHYQIIIDREDNIALAKMETEIDGEIVKSVVTNKPQDTITIDDLFFTKAGSYSYRSYATDQNGNETTKQITLNIKIPDITVTNVEKISTTQAAITAELSQDIDEGTVSFQKNRHGYRSPLSTTNGVQDYSLQPKMTIIQWQYYQLNDNIALYTKENQAVAEIDPNTWELKIKDAFKNKVIIKVSLASHSPVIQVYNEAGQLLFNIILPTEKLIDVIAPSYTVTTINDKNFWALNGGKVVQRNGEDILFVSPTWQIYSEKNLVGTYRYNADKSVSYLFKETEDSTDIIEVIVKIKAFQP